MSRAIEALSRNIVQTGYDSLSQEDIEFAKNRVIDVLGCAIGGALAPGNAILLELVREWGGKKEASILGYGIKVPAHNAAMVNSTMVRSYDYEASGHYVENVLFPCHSHSVTVTTAFAVGESLKANGKDLLTALILGDDFLARLTAAADWKSALDDSLWDCSGTMSKWGATAIAGKLLGLDTSHMVNAFGIVVDTVACTKQAMFDGAQTFKLHSGLSSRDAIVSAKLAGRGFTGVKDPLLGEFGFLPVYFSHYLTMFPDILEKDLGKKFYSAGGIGHKYYPCCGGNDLYIECALKIIQMQDFDPDDIVEIVIVPVNTSPIVRALSCSYESENASQVRATFNIPYNIASILVRKSTTKLEHFTDDAVRDPKVIEIAKKVKFEEAKTKPRKGASVTVKMKDGRTFEEWANSVKGGPGRQLTREDLREKFRANVEFTKILNKNNSEKALEMIEHLEEIQDIRQVVKLLCNNSKQSAVN